MPIVKAPQGSYRWRGVGRMGVGRQRSPPIQYPCMRPMEMVLRPPPSCLSYVLCFHPHRDDEFLFVALTRFFNRKEGSILSMALTPPPEDFRVVFLHGSESHFPARTGPQEPQNYLARPQPQAHQSVLQPLCSSPWFTPSSPWGKRECKAHRTLEGRNLLDHKINNSSSFFSESS